MKGLSSPISLISLVLAGILSANFVLAENSLEMFINEIAWMGQEVSSANEWVELYNSSDSPTSLDGWVLKAADGVPETSLAGIVPAQGFYLLERTDDDTVPDVSADRIYKGALENEGEVLELYDNLGNLIDSVNCSTGWLAGDNTTKQTMERKDSDSWQMSQPLGGTPKAKNSVITQATEKQPESETKIEPQEEAKIIYPSGIVINEILPSPTGPDSEEEWVEIFNQNNFEIGLFDWQITDVTGKTTLYTFPKETSMSPQEFLVLRRPTSKITLNNSGDGLKLSQPDGNIADAVNYEKASQGKSFNRTEYEWIWSSTLTPGALNIIPAPESKENLQEEAEPFEDEADERELAAAGEQVSQTGSASSFVLLIAIPLAVLSGIIILGLKTKFIAKRSKEIKNRLR